MATFKDTQDREWTIRIDAPTILRVREEADKDFLLRDDVAETNTYQRLSEDPVLLCTVIHLLCKDQIKKRELTQAEFFESVIGDSIDAATEAMLQAILSFIPRRTRELLEVSAAKTSKIQDLATSRALAKINDPEIEAKLLAAIEAKVDREIERALTRLSSATS